MGLLTDPNAGHGKLIKLLIRYYSKVCFLLYVAGIVWFCLLAHPPVNQGTYYSENALLAGLVKTEFREQNDAKIYHDELLEEIKKYDDSLPYPWLLAKFRQLGLDTYTHNFTLNYPLGSRQKYTGKNVYAILRAPRAASTEALVMSVPYRHPLSVHLPTNPGIAMMLAFAKFATRGQYWSKDIIFLITEHEQLGAQAWLESYHGISCGQEGVLDYGELNGRAGAIQAAINLEIHDVNIGRIDVKIEGLNGQLPNLDLFNLATRMCSKENVAHTFKNRPLKFFNDPLKHWWYSMRTMLSMVATQATGVPNGNHGLFYRFGVQALTLEGFAPNAQNQYRHSFLSLGRILEQLFRSLNNLLERFHQSYFFYLLPSSSRFVSIGLYIPSVCLIAAVLFIKSYAIWFKLNVDKGFDAEVTEEDLKALEKQTAVKAPKQEQPASSYDHLTDKDWRKMFLQEIQTSNANDDDSLDLGYMGAIFIGTHIIGFAFKQMPPLMTSFGNLYAFDTDVTILAGLTAASSALLLLPFLAKRLDYHTLVMLNILCLLELGTTIICVSMYNFSLGLIVGTIYVPFAFIMRPTYNRLFCRLQKTLWILVHPLVLVTVIILVTTYITFPEERTKTMLLRGLGGTQHALTYGILDSMIYGSWFYSATCCILLPNWLCFWFLTFVKQQTGNARRPKSAGTKLKEQ